MDTKKSGRRYDREFKENAVALVQSGHTATQVARDLGVSTWSLNRWVAQARAGSAQGEPRTLAAETPEQRVSCAGCGRSATICAGNATS